MAEPDNLTLVLLRELRADMNRQFEELRLEIKDNGKKLDHLTRTALGESVLARYTTAAFEDRIGEIERRLDALESRR